MSIHKTAGQKLLAVELMGLVGLNNVGIVYNQDETIHTVEDLEEGTFLTFAYGLWGEVDYIHDGTNKWTISYDNFGRVEATTRTTL